MDGRKEQPKKGTLAHFIELKKSKQAIMNQQQLSLEEDTGHDNTSMETVPAEVCLGESSRQRDHLVAPSEQGQKKKCRGLTKVERVHARRLEDRVEIRLNGDRQPEGPDKPTVNLLSSFLGTMAKLPHFCPIDCVDWRQLTTHDEMWNYVQMKWIIPEEGRKWVLATINSAWRRYKNDIKKLHIKPYDTDEERLQNLPAGFHVEQFKGFLKIMKSKSYKKMAKKNKRNRKKQDMMHTTGRTSFAIVKKKLKMKNENHASPTRSEMFLETRKRVDGRPYKNDGVATQEMITQMEEIQRTQPVDDNNSPLDPFSVIRPKEHPGRVRLAGRGVTMTDIKNKASGSGGPNIVHEDFMAKMEARMTAMEAKIAASAEDRAAVEAQVEANFMTRLQAILPQFDSAVADRLVAEFLPGDASSVQRTRNLGSSVAAHSSSNIGHGSAH